MVKLVMMWDVQGGKEEAHIEFLARTFIPRMVKLDVRLTDIWSTLYGDAPQITIGWLAEDRASVRKTLDSREWRSLYEQLEPLVKDFKYAVVAPDTPLVF